jgi:hypothetical protein
MVVICDTDIDFSGVPCQCTAHHHISKIWLKLAVSITNERDRDDMAGDTRKIGTKPPVTVVAMIA